MAYNRNTHQPTVVLVGTTGPRGKRGWAPRLWACFRPSPSAPDMPAAATDPEVAPDPEADKKAVKAAKAFDQWVRNSTVTELREAIEADNADADDIVASEAAGRKRITVLRLAD